MSRGRSAEDGRPSLRYEQRAWAARTLLIGVDEVGRGPLAGPVVAAAAVFAPDVERIPGVRDSKTLSAAQRGALVPLLLAQARVVRLGAASVREIDHLNIRVATALAMRRAILPVRVALGSATPTRILLDGLPMPECGEEHESLVDGDVLCYSIAAAGILAKEVRDRLMGRLARRHPGYGWEHNAGYATAIHRAALLARGPTPHHRRSFAPVAQLEIGF